MKKAILCAALVGTLGGCDVLTQLLTGLGDVAEEHRTNPIYAYGTLRGNASGEVAGLIVTHIDSDNRALDRWSTLNTVTAGGAFAIHDTLAFSPDRSRLALFQFEPFGGAVAMDCMSADCVVIIYDSRTGATRFSMTDNVAGDVVHANCPSPDPTPAAVIAFDELLAAEAAFAAENGTPNPLSGATLTVVPYAQAGPFMVEAYPDPGSFDSATNAELDLIGWTGGGAFVSEYTSNDPHFIRLQDGSLEPLVDFSASVPSIFEVRSTRYLAQNADGTVQTCAATPITVQADTPVRNVTTVYQPLPPAPDAPEEDRFVTVFRIDNLPLVQLFAPGRAYRTRANTSVPVSSGPFTHNLAP